MYDHVTTGVCRLQRGKILDLMLFHLPDAGKVADWRLAIGEFEFTRAVDQLPGGTLGLVWSFTLYVIERSFIYTLAPTKWFINAPTCTTELESSFA